MKCNKHGKCKVQYYDPRHDRSRYDNRYDNRYYNATTVTTTSRR